MIKLNEAGDLDFTSFTPMDKPWYAICVNGAAAYITNVKPREEFGFLIMDLQMVVKHKEIGMFADGDIDLVDFKIYSLPYGKVGESHKEYANCKFEAMDGDIMTVSIDSK